eukprot:gene32834-39700_t
MDFLKVGDDVDILSNFVYHCGRIVKISQRGWRVHYLGWDDSYDETIGDPARLAESQTFTFRPMVDNEDGMDELRAEPKVYLVPCGPINKYMLPYHHGVWIHSKHLASLSGKLEECKSEAMSFKYDFADLFAQALDELQTRYKDALDLPLKFDGSLELNTYAMLRRRQLGDTQSRRSIPTSPSEPLPKAKRGRPCKDKAAPDASEDVSFQPSQPVLLASALRLDLQWVGEKKKVGGLEAQFLESIKRYWEQQPSDRSRSTESGAAAVASAGPRCDGLHTPSDTILVGTSNSAARRKAAKPVKNRAAGLEGALPTPFDPAGLGDQAAGALSVSFTSKRTLRHSGMTH